MRSQRWTSRTDPFTPFRFATWWSQTRTTGCVLDGSSGRQHSGSGPHHDTSSDLCLSHRTGQAVSHWQEGMQTSIYRNVWGGNNGRQMCCTVTTTWLHSDGERGGFPLQSKHKSPREIKDSAGLLFARSDAHYELMPPSHLSNHLPV